MIEFRMPTLGADMEAGTLIEWVKKPGDTVARGDIIAVVDTDKGAIEVEVFNDGVVDRVLVEPGQKTPVGAVLAIIREPGEAAGPAPVEPMLPTAQSAAPVAPSPAPPLPPSPSRPRVSPAARKAAGQLHVELESLAGTGPGGAVTLADVERAAAAGKPAARADRPAAMRAAVGAAMARSKREIPHLYLSTTVDVTPALRWMEADNLRRPVAERLLPVILFVKAVARACGEAPQVNGFWTERGFAPGPGVHVGCAIALRGGGLVAPALHEADKKSLSVLAREFADLVQRARAGALRSSEMSDPTITLTNLGDLGVESAYAVIYPPQVAIVAFGKIAERPWVVEGRVEPRSVVTVGVSADHRALDGRAAGAFLAAIGRALGAPDTL
jgi:pyruvate dehydrogenase E2 component (dihydrolipoamide acetyltransferase)